MLNYVFPFYFFPLSVIDLVILEKYYRISVFCGFFPQLLHGTCWGRKAEEKAWEENLRSGTFGVLLLADNPNWCLVWTLTISVPRLAPQSDLSFHVSMLKCISTAVSAVFTELFFLRHTIFKSIYAWNRQENLVGVRLSFSSGVSPFILMG